jgi:hypothetical protein
MANHPLRFLSSLSTRLPSTVSAPSAPGNDNINDVAMSDSSSWRTFSDSSAPSEQLSYYRDVHLHTVGRVINRLGTLIVDPIDNFMARRKFKNALNYLESVETDEEWAVAIREFQCPGALSGLLEAGR